MTVHWLSGILLALMTKIPNEESLQQILDQAGSIAAHAGVQHSSVHLVLALITLDNEARRTLVDRGLTVQQYTDRLEKMGDQACEPSDMLSEIRDRCQRLATSCRSAKIGPLHLVIVLCSIPESLAFQSMTATGLDLPGIRYVALALLTSGSHRNSSTLTSSETLTGSTASVFLPSGRAPLRPEIPGMVGGRSSGISLLQKKRNALLDPRVTRGAPLKDPHADPAAGTTPFALDEKQFPTLLSMARNLSEAAALGLIEPLVGRRQHVERILDTLGKRRSNNPCLIGEPGVGKTAIVEGLAYLQVHEPQSVPLLKNRLLVELNMGSLLSGTGLRGAFSERMATIRKEVEQAEGRIIVFLDEIHTLVGAGAVGDGALDAVSELSAAMARGSFPCIGATTTENFKRYIEETAALQRRLQPILVEEPASEEAMEILQGILPAYAKHHKVTYLPEAFDAAVRLSGRYIADRYLPDKAISLLDLAGSRARRRDKKLVGRSEVAELIAESTGIPVDRLLMTDTDRFLKMEQFMRRQVIGHDSILQRTCQVIRRNYAGFSSQRPIGSFLFLGPTGVGKTETVKVLADFLFQSREALCRFDMSEFMEPHSIARFIGSPPGYVGHEQGGQLTESVRHRPYQIVLLDEVEKAHRDVLQILLQVLDDGRLTDGRGRTVDFSNTVVVMTSNLGSDHYGRRSSGIGFGAANGNADTQWKDVTEAVLTTARKALPIELWNRIEERLVFEPLTKPQVLDVARLLVKASSSRLEAEKSIRFEATTLALDFLIAHGGFDVSLGARPMRTTIQRLIEGLVAEKILTGEARAGDTLRIDCMGGILVVESVRNSAKDAVNVAILDQPT